MSAQQVGEVLPVEGRQHLRAGVGDLALGDGLELVYSVNDLADYAEKLAIRARLLLAR